MPILNCAMHADEGILRSGVAVETMIRSMSFGSSPAAAIASSPARVARSEVYSSGSAMCRSRMPNVSNTHCGEVGKFATTSSLVRILDGTYEPVDLMQTLSKWVFRPLILPYRSGPKNERPLRWIHNKNPTTQWKQNSPFGISITVTRIMFEKYTVFNRQKSGQRWLTRQIIGDAFLTPWRKARKHVTSPPQLAIVPLGGRFCTLQIQTSIC